MDDRSSLWAVKLPDIFREAMGLYANTVTFSISPKIGESADDALCVGVALPSELERGEYWWLKNDEVGTTSVSFTRDQVESGDNSIYLIIGDQYGDILTVDDLADYIALLYDAYDFSIVDDLQIDNLVYIDGIADNILAVYDNYKPVAVYYNGDIVPNVSAIEKKETAQNAREITFDSKYNQPLQSMEIVGHTSRTERVESHYSVFNPMYISIGDGARGFQYIPASTITEMVLVIDDYLAIFDASETVGYCIRITVDDPSYIADLNRISFYRGYDTVFIVDGGRLAPWNGETFFGNFRTGSNRIGIQFSGALSRDEVESRMTALRNHMTVKLWRYDASHPDSSPFYGYPSADGSVHSPTPWLPSVQTPFNRYGSTISLGEQEYTLSNMYTDAPRAAKCLLESAGEYRDKVTLRKNTIGIHSVCEKISIGENTVFQYNIIRKAFETNLSIAGVLYHECAELRKGIDYDITESGILRIYAQAVNVETVEELAKYIGSTPSRSITFTYVSQSTMRDNEFSVDFDFSAVRGENVLTVTPLGDIQHNPHELSANFFD